jgi:hypothetical protein
VKLNYARDRLVENYFWTCGVFAKTFGLSSLMDDTYDVYATVEECHILNDAIQRYVYTQHTHINSR